MRNRNIVERYAAYTADLDAKHGTMESAAWLDLYSRELDNIQNAFSHAAQDPSLHAQAIAIALNTAWYWHESGRAGEGRAMLERALQLPLGTRDGAEVHRMIGMLHFAAGNYGDAITHAQEALERGLEIQPAEPAHRYYTLYANALLYAGRYDEAEQYYRLAVDSAHGANRPGDLSVCRFNLAILMYECKGDFANARRMLAASLETKAVDEFDEALAEETLGRIAFLERDFAEAVSHADASMALLQRIGNGEHLLEVSMRQCVYRTMADDLETAMQLWQQHGAGALASGNPETLAVALDACAYLQTARGDLQGAVSTRALLEHYRGEHHLVIFPVERRVHDAWDFAVRAILGKQRYENAVAIGRATRIEDAAQGLFA